MVFRDASPEPAGPRSRRVRGRGGMAALDWSAYVWLLDRLAQAALEEARGGAS